MRKLMLLVLLTGCSEETTQQLLPLNLAFTFHLEGTSLVASQTAFDRYVTQIRATAALFHQNGAIATWDSAEIVEASKKYGLNILLELEAGGDAIGLHTNGVGYSVMPGYSQEIMEAQFVERRTQMEALGITPRHGSNICSALDWVTALRKANIEAATGLVEFCLKSLPASEQGTAADCASPNLCHDPYASETTTSWYAENGSNWTTHAKTGLLLIPSAGAVPCAAESAAGVVSPTMCPYTSDDVTAVIAEIDAALLTRKPGGVHSYVMVASFGQDPDPTVVGNLLQRIKSEYVDTGKAAWVSMPDLIDLNK